MTLNNYKTGEAIREATIEEAIRSMTAGDEGVIEVDGVSCYVDGCNEVWAVVNGDLSGPAWAIGTSEREARDRFIATRDGLGIDPANDEFRAVKITPGSALLVLGGNPDAWEEIDA